MQTHSTTGGRVQRIPSQIGQSHEGQAGLSTFSTTVQSSPQNPTQTLPRHTVMSRNSRPKTSWPPQVSQSHCQLPSWLSQLPPIGLPPIPVHSSPMRPPLPTALLLLVLVAAFSASSSLVLVEEETSRSETAAMALSQQRCQTKLSAHNVNISRVGCYKVAAC